MVSKEIMELAARFNIGKKVETESNTLSYPGFTLVPSINLYVSDQVVFLDSSWEDCFAKLSSKEGYRMLTSSEFWKYIEFKNREGIEDILQNSFGDEWLNCLYKPNENSNVLSRIKGTYISKVNDNETKLIQEKKLKTGYFGISDIDLETGLPKKISRNENLEFKFRKPVNDKESVLCRWRGPDLNHYSFEFDREFTDPNIGVRPAFKPGSYVQNFE